MRYLTDTQKDLLVQIHNAKTFTLDGLLQTPSIPMSTKDLNAIVSHLVLIPEQSFNMLHVYRVSPEMVKVLQADGRIK